MRLKSKYLQDAALNWYKGTAYPTAPTNVYAGLMTTAPTAIDGTGQVEVTGGSYARQAISASTGWGTISTNGSGTSAFEQLPTGATITYPTASANWGTIVGVSLFDAVSAGNFLEYGDLTVQQTVNSGDTFSFSSANLTVAE